MGELHSAERPRCHNRPPYTGRWIRMDYVRFQRVPWRLKPVYRWHPHVMSDECKAWDSGPSPISESVPARAGWKCEGCRWLPASAAAYLIRTSETQAADSTTCR